VGVAEKPKALERGGAVMPDNSLQLGLFYS